GKAVARARPVERRAVPKGGSSGGGARPRPGRTIPREDGEAAHLLKPTGKPPPEEASAVARVIACYARGGGILDRRPRFPPISRLSLPADRPISLPDRHADAARGDGLAAVPVHPLAALARLARILSRRSGAAVRSLGRGGRRRFRPTAIDAGQSNPAGAGIHR